MPSSHGQVAAVPADFAPRRVPLRDIALPDRGELHLWFMDLGEMAGSLRAALDGSGAADEDKPYTGGQLTFTRRFFLRLLLGAYLDLPGKEIRIVRNRRGKPLLDPGVHGQDLHFSIAKSGFGFLVGLSSTTYVGVDVEPVERRAHNALGVARRYFSKNEAEALEAMDAGTRSRAFMKTWSSKEAVVKAMGLGIANQLCRFTVDTNPENPAAILAFEGDDPDAWWLQLVRPAESFLGAVATRSKPVRLTTFRLLPAAKDGRR